MNKLAIMQPYFFPYLGYFQLIQAVDTFVIYDNVQYIRRGWINRNRILLHGTDHYITLPVQKGHREDEIREKRFSEEFGAAKQKILRQVRIAYKKAPFFYGVMPVLEEIFACSREDVSGFLFHQLQILCKQLGIQTKLLLSSSLYTDDDGLSGPERILSICNALNATQYINLSGGKALYDPKMFQAAGIDLKFINMHRIEYPQWDQSFAQSLSIIDVMMFNTNEQMSDLLQEYDLLS